MKKEQEKEIFNPEELIETKMRQLESDAISLAANISAEDKNTNPDNIDKLKKMYLLSNGELNNYLVHDMVYRDGRGWNHFTDEYNRMLPKHREPFRPTIVAMDNFLTKPIGELKKSYPMWLKERESLKDNSRKRAYEKLESIKVQDKSSKEDNLGFWGGMAAVYSGATGAAAGYAAGTAAGATAGTVAIGAAAATGGIFAAGVGAAVAGHYAGKMYADKTIAENDRYIKDQQRRVRELREKQKRNRKR